MDQAAVIEVLSAVVRTFGLIKTMLDPARFESVVVGAKITRRR